MSHLPAQPLGNVTELEAGLDSVDGHDEKPSPSQSTLHQKAKSGYVPVELEDPPLDSPHPAIQQQPPEKPPPPTCMGVPMSLIALGSLTVIQTIAPLQTSWTRRLNIESGGPRYLNSTMILAAEAIKTFASLSLVIRDNNFNVSAGLQSAYVSIVENYTDTLKVAVPGVLYVFQNNMLLYAMDKVSPPVYQVTYQLKILTTALMSVIMLGKQLGGMKWLALVILTAGVSMVQLRGARSASDSLSQAGGENQGSGTFGIIAILCACFTSGLAGVWLEKMLKQSSVSIWMRNIQLGMIGSIIALVTAFVKDQEKIIEYGLLQGFTSREYLLAFQVGCSGLASAAVLKYADNILKCFAAGISIIAVSIIAALCFQDAFSLDMLFALGSIFVILAIFLYNVDVSAYFDLSFLLGKMEKQSLPSGSTVGNAKSG